MFLLESVRSVSIQNSQIARHSHQSTENTVFRTGTQQGRIGRILHLAAGVKDQPCGRILGDEPDHVPILLHLHTVRLIGHSFQGRFIGVVVIGQIGIATYPKDEKDC